MGNWPISASIGYPNVHLKGSTSARLWAQSGISDSGTRRPEKSSSTVMTTSTIGPSRVVQNAAIPRFEYISARTK